MLLKKLLVCNFLSQKPRVIVLIALFFLSSTILLFPSGIEFIPQFHVQNDSELITSLFTVNVGVMNFKRIGNINSISPVDYKNIVTTIKNELDTVPSIKLDRRAALIKTLRIIKEKSDDSIDGLDFLERQLFFSYEKIDNALIASFMTKMRKNSDFLAVSRTWFENYENPYYVLNTGEPFDRVFDSAKNICSTQKVNDEGPIDILFYGSVEKVGALYVITISAYSYHDDRILKEISFAANSENLTATIKSELGAIIPEIFKVNYASLSINANEEGVRIYLDSHYMGKTGVLIPYVVPMSYVVTLRKENYFDKKVNVKLANSQNKTLAINLDKKKKLQVVNFYIEPLGTKVYINSVYQGRTPFKKAFPEGTYVISAKNDLYQDYRYLFTVSDPSEEELSIVYHLQTKDLTKYFKVKQYLYYAAFWNFTFSLAATIPSVILSFTMWQGYGNHNDPNYSQPYQIAYGFAVGLTIHTIISAGWLFYSLADYLKTYEKKDFIPIIDFYRDKDGKDLLTLGGIVQLRRKRSIQPKPDTT